MTEYLLPDGMTIEAAAEALRGRLAVRGRPARQVDRTYYDTFDGLLRGAGLIVVHDDGQLALVERASGTVRAKLNRARPTEPLFVRDLQPGRLADAVQRIVEPRALLPITEIHARERPLDVVDDEQKTVVRLRLERPRAREARLRISGVRGYDDELRRVEQVVEKELGFRIATQPLLDEVAPPGPSSKIEVPLRAEQRADTAAAIVLRRLLGVIEANFEGTIGDIDSEFLHDLRVSVRRSRSVQRELKKVFPPAELERFRGEFRWLQQVTGDSRDLDVYVLEFAAMRALVPEPMRGDLDPLLDILRGRRLAARREMASALRSERARALLSAWPSFLEQLEIMSPQDRPDAARPIAAVAGERIRKVYKRMVKMGRAIDESSPAEDYHELRKKGKELRYLLELFAAPLYPAEVVKPMIKALKGLQDVLGHHQDRVVQIAMLGSLRDELSDVQGGAAALMAMGMLVQRLGEDELAARARFAERFANFASKSQRKQVEATFE